MLFSTWYSVILSGFGLRSSHFRPSEPVETVKYDPTRAGGECLYAAEGGRRTQSTFGTSMKPSMCWQVRIQTLWLGFGTP